MHVDISVCGTVCSISFNVPENGNYQLNLQAINNRGNMSETVTQKIFIGKDLMYITTHIWCKNYPFSLLYREQ